MPRKARSFLAAYVSENGAVYPRDSDGIFVIRVVGLADQQDSFAFSTQLNRGLVMGLADNFHFSPRKPIVLGKYDEAICRDGHALDFATLTSGCNGASI